METINDEQDRISELPNEILSQTLSFMTTKLAIQTSILSKRWQHLWKFTSTVHFCNSFPYHPFRAVDYSFVDQTLDHHRSPELQNFIIDATVRGDVYANLAPRWVEFALARHVQTLILNFKTSPLPDSTFDFPLSFYTNNQSLKQVSLGVANINPPLGFQGFASLKSLRLWCCKLNDEIMHEMLLKCELLEILIIDKCRELKNVKIFGPRLKHVTFVRRPQRYTWVEVDNAPNLVSLKYCGSGKCIFFGYLPCLVEAKLFLDSSDNVIDIDVVKALLDEKLSHVELLGVDYWFLRFLAKEQATNCKLWTASKSLQNFYWFGPLNKEYDLALLIAFLADCSSLERINIYSRDYDRDGITKGSYTYGFQDVFVKIKDGKMKPSVGFLNQVRKIDYCYFSGYESEMEMIKLLLQKAVILDSLLVTFEEPNNKDGFVLQKDLCKEEISCLPRASSHARIIFG